MNVTGECIRVEKRAELRESGWVTRDAPEFTFTPGVGLEAGVPELPPPGTSGLDESVACSLDEMAGANHEGPRGLATGLARYSTGTGIL